MTWLSDVSNYDCQRGFSRNLARHLVLSTAIMRAAPKSSVAGDSTSTSSVAAMSGHKELLGDDY